MSAMPAPKIDDPADLYVPEFADDSEFIAHIISEHMTEEGATEFFSEFFVALRRSKAEADLRHVNRVIETWVRSFMVVHNDEFDAKWHHARKAKPEDSPILSLEDIKRRLRVT